MICNFYNPVPALSEIVEHYWYFKLKMGGPSVQHHPTLLAQCLIFNFNAGQEIVARKNKAINLNKSVYFFGQQTSSRIIATNDKRIHVLGAKFNPLGMAKLLGINMAAMADNIIDAEDIWNRELDSVSDEIQSSSNIEEAIRVLEIFLLKKYSQNKMHHRINTVDKALFLIQNSKGCMNISDLHIKANTTKRTLERAFINYLGITPKLYSRITRFNAAKDWMDKEILNPKLLELAYDLSYSDGSHFSAEFKRFADLTPSEYLQKRHLELFPAI